MPALPTQLCSLASRVALASCCALAASVAHPARAQQASPQDERVHVVVSNGFHVMDMVPPPKQDAKGLRQGVASSLTNQPERFVVHTGERLRQRLMRQRLFKDRLDLARTLAKDGIESYRELKMSRASSQLEKAVAQYDTIHYDSVDPQEVARALLYLVLSNIELGTRLPQTMRVMRRMLMLDPKIEFKRGYYTDRVVDVYEEQRRAILRELKQRGPGIEHIEEAQFLASQTGASHVVMGVILARPDGSFEPTLYVYDVEQARFGQGVSMVVSDTSQASLRDAGNMLMSQIKACWRAPEVQVAGPAPSKGKSPLSISLKFAYATFLNYPVLINDAYDNVGMGIGAKWLFTQEFGAVAGFDLLVARPDFGANIATANHSTYRGFLGGELGVDFKFARFATQLATEITHMSAFDVWGEKQCKFPDNPATCDRSSKESYDTYGLMLGLNLRPIVSVSLLESLHAFASVNATFFFYTGDEREFNFPVGAEAGMQYRF